MNLSDEEASVSSDNEFDDILDNSVDESVVQSKHRHRKGSSMVYFVLSIAAVAFGVSTFFMLKKAEEVEFTTDFNGYARETKNIAENNAVNTFGQLKSFATAITSIVQDSQRSFPNVTIPHFDRRAEDIARIAGAEMVLFIPFVEQENRKGFEKYSVEHQDWITQDYVSIHTIIVREAANYLSQLTSWVLSFVVFSKTIDCVIERSLLVAGTPQRFLASLKKSTPFSFHRAGTIREEGLWTTALWKKSFLASDMNRKVSLHLSLSLDQDLSTLLSA